MEMARQDMLKGAASIPIENLANITPKELKLGPIEIEKGHPLYDPLYRVYPDDRQEVMEKFANVGFEKQQQAERLRKVHVIDNLDDDLCNDDVVYRKVFQTVVEARNLAKRFIFDDESCTHLGTFIRDNVDVWFDGRKFAIPPYPTTYIQINCDNVIKAIGKPANSEFYDRVTRDVDTGYLIHKNIVYAMSRRDLAVNPNERAAITTFSYEILNWNRTGCYCRPLFGIPIDPNDDKDHYQRASLLLGSTINDMEQGRWSQFLHDMLIHVNVSDEKFKGLTDEERSSKGWRLIVSSQGEFRIVIAALILLNQQKHIQTVHVPNETKWVKGKTRVVKQHSRVVLHLDALHQIKRTLGRQLMTPRAEHDVRGHLRNIHLRIGCEHQWEDLSDPGEHGHMRWVCTKCNGLRTTVTAHKRGDLSVGRTEKRYDVKE
jgi:hypothetical protein